MNYQIIQKHMLENLKQAPLDELQDRWLTEFYSPEKVIHLKGKRASGRSSFGVGLLITNSMLYSNQHYVIIGNRELVNYRIKQAKEYIEQTTSFISKFFNAKIDYPIIRSNVNTVELNNGSYIRAISSELSLRGMTLNGAFIDQSNIHTMEDLNYELLASLMPSLAFNDSKLIVSMDCDE